MDFVRFTALFCFIYAGCKYGIKFGFPKFYTSLDERKQSEYYAYLACLFHHFAAVAIALYTIYHDVGNVDPSPSRLDLFRTWFLRPQCLEVTWSPISYSRVQERFVAESMKT
jgi:hypothetical protein